MPTWDWKEGRVSNVQYKNSIWLTANVRWLTLFNLNGGHMSICCIILWTLLYLKIFKMRSSVSIFTAPHTGTVVSPGLGQVNRVKQRFSALTCFSIVLHFKQLVSPLSLRKGPQEAENLRRSSCPWLVDRLNSSHSDSFSILFVVELIYLTLFQLHTVIIHTILKSVKIKLELFENKQRSQPLWCFFFPRKKF
jgi:hypothetical protein